MSTNAASSDSNTQNSQKSQSNSTSGSALIQSEFAEYTDDINMFMKKYKDFYAQTLNEDQKRLDEINNFHNMISDFLAFLNQKLKTQKERISKFYSKFDEEKVLSQH